MAGFAIVITIFTYGFLGLISACILSLVLHKFAKGRVLDAGLTRHQLTREAAAAPFLGLLWIIVALLLHVAISNRFAHQDCGVSGDPYVTLPNGYKLGSLNTYSGYIVAPGFETDIPATGPGYVRSLITIQWKAPYFTGFYDDMHGKAHSFTFDTRDRSIQSNVVGEIDFEQTQKRVHEDSNSYWVLYSTYRKIWPGYVLLFIILSGEIAIAGWLWKTARAPELMVASRDRSSYQLRLS